MIQKHTEKDTLMVEDFIDYATSIGILQLEETDKIMINI
jgi:hypothetical protein